MKLSIERAGLLRSLGHVQNVVERRTTIPILSNVKLSADDGRLGLTATDMDLSLVAQEQAEVGRAGTTTVAAHTLFDIVRKLPDGSAIAIEQNGQAGEITVRAGRSVFNLPTLPADEFPAIGEEQLGVRFAMPAGDLAKLIDKTRFAISTEETRYYLNGIHVHATRGGAAAMLRGVATDGHRLGRGGGGRPTAPGGRGSRGRCPRGRSRSRRSSSRARRWARSASCSRARPARSRSASRRPASSSRSAARCWCRG